LVLYRGPSSPEKTTPREGHEKCAHVPSHHREVPDQGGEMPRMYTFGVTFIMKSKQLDLGGETTKCWGLGCVFAVFEKGGKEGAGGGGVPGRERVKCVRPRGIMWDARGC